MVFLFLPKNLKNPFFLTSSDSPSTDTNEGINKVPREDANLGIYEGTNSDINKVSDKTPETETGVGTNKSPDNKPETNKDVNKGSNEKPSTEPTESEEKAEVPKTPVPETSLEPTRRETPAELQNPVSYNDSKSTTARYKG